MKFVKLLLYFSLLLVVKNDFISNKVIFTNEPCVELREEAIFLPIENNTGQYKQCGPAGYYWIFPCSPGTIFAKSQRACVRPDSDETTTTNSTTNVFHVNNLTRYSSFETSQLPPNTVTVSTSQINVDTSLKNLYDVIVYFPENVIVESNLSSLNRTTTTDYYYDNYDSRERSTLQVITTTLPSVETTKEPKYYTLSNVGPEANLNENQIYVNLLNSQKENNVAAAITPDYELSQPENSDYYKYHVSTIRRTPSTFESTRYDNAMYGTTVKSQYEPPQSQWRGYQQDNSNGISQNIADSQKSSLNDPDNRRNQKPPPFYTGGHNAKPPNAPLSPGAQELAKIISEEDLETLSRVFGILATQQGPGPGVIPGSNPPGPIMMPTGFIPPLPEAGGGLMPQGPDQNQISQFYNMLPPPVVPQFRTTEPPRQFHIVAECVENGTCSHDDTAETYCLHPSDPVSYYQCSPGVDYGIWVLRQCPAGLHFNNEGECGKRRPGVNPPSPPATRAPIQIQSQNVAATKIQTNSNEKSNVWPPHSYEQLQPELSHVTQSINPFVLMQTITPESSYISENNMYPENAFRGSNEQPIRQTNAQSKNNLNFVKPPQPTWDKNVQPRISSQENIATGTSVLYPGIHQTVNQFQANHIIGPRIPTNSVKPNQPAGNIAPQIQPRPPGFPQVEVITDQSKPNVGGGNGDSIQGKQGIGGQFVQQQGQSNSQTSGNAVAPRPNVPRPNLIVPPQQPTPLQPKSSNELIKPIVLGKAPPLAIGEQLIQQPRFPPELEPVFQNMIPNSSSLGGPPGSMEANSGRPKQPPVNTIQQTAAGLIYGGYPRYPEIPQLKIMTESAWNGNGHSNVQQQAAINGQKLQPYSPQQSAYHISQTFIRPKQFQQVQNNLFNAAPLGYNFTRVVKPRNVWSVDQQLLKDLRRDSPIIDDSSFRISQNNQPPEEEFQKSQDTLFNDLMSAKLKTIEAFVQALAESKSPQQKQPSSSLLFPYGLNYVKSNDNNGYRLFVAGKSDSPSSSYRSKLLHKTQERDKANFTVPFWPVNGAFTQPFVGQKCFPLSSTKAVKFDSNTYLACIPKKTFNNDTSVGSWVIMTCGENEMFDRLLKKCT